MAHPENRLFQKPTLAWSLFVIFLLVLWIAGGASRADVPGQIVTRLFAWMVLLFSVAFMDRPDLREAKAPAIFVFGSLLLAVIHMLPLPPALWSALPGRMIFLEAAEIADTVQPWRPISISPGATANALASLVVPVSVLLLLTKLKHSEIMRSTSLLLLFIGLSAIWGLLEFAGLNSNHPLINDQAGAVSGPFANRNHFALLCAIGCVLAPAWAIQSGRGQQWRLPAAFVMILLFLLVILATGSRSGIIVGLLGTASGGGIAFHQMKAVLFRLKRKSAIALIAVAGLLVSTIFTLSFLRGRAVSLERLSTLDAGQELRIKALPVLFDMIEQYFPVGAGFGTFDPAFRMAEPNELLSVLYFNHAHNDFVEIVLDGGLPATALLTAAILWWLKQGYLAVKSADRENRVLSRAGFSTILLILVASIFDYPARTPIMMAVLVIGAFWLNQVSIERRIDNAGPERSSGNISLET